MGQRADKPRINVELTEAEDVQAYNNLKGLAAIHGMQIRDVLIPAMHEALARLQKRTLPLNTTIRLSKKKGVETVEQNRKR